MTTNFTLLNHGPKEIALASISGGVRGKVPEIIQPGQFSTNKYVYEGFGYQIQENGSVDPAQDSDIIEYGTVRGEQRTIHASEHLDVEVDAEGDVVAVWFRCACLPFKQANVDWQRARSMRADRSQIDKLGLMAVTLRRKT